MSQVHVALRKKFASPEWAYFEEVRNGTGFARSQTRSADALAFSLWPSRGLELHGVEVKVSRSDWLREKNDPAKAEEIGQFCARWWLATARDVVKDVGELPTTWGWLELEKDGKTLRQRRAAPKREAKPIDLPMVAALLRRASEDQCAHLSALVEPQVTARMADERERHAEQVRQLTDDRNEYMEDARRLKAIIQQIEYQLGEPILEMYGAPKLKELPKELVEKLQAFKQVDVKELRVQLADANRILREVSTRARLALRGEFAKPDPFRGRRW